MVRNINICVFLGAKAGKNPDFRVNANLLGLEIARQNCTLVYGGARDGLMGILADAVLNAGGKAIGVMPSSLPCELQHQHLTKLHIVDTMQERKILLSSLADAFVFFPGGLGTLEELFEVWNAQKIGLHCKPLSFLNINGYYDVLFNFLKNCLMEELILEEHLNQALFLDSPKLLVQNLRKQALINVKSI